MKKLLITAFALLAFAAGSQAQTNDKNAKNMKTIALTKADFLKKVANYEKNPEEWKYLGDKPALIDFYASWCGPCKALAPVLEELAAEYGDRIYIYKINTEEEQELAAAFGIRSIPTLLFIPMEGKPQMAQGALGHLGFAFHRDEQQRGDRADAERRGKLLFLLGVDLVDVDPVPVFGGQFFEHRCEGLAGTAPRGVEVDQGGFVTEVFPLLGIFFIVGDLLQKVGFGQCDRFHILCVFVVCLCLASGGEGQQRESGYEQFFHLVFCCSLSITMQR